MDKRMYGVTGNGRHNINRLAYGRNIHRISRDRKRIKDGMKTGRIERERTTKCAYLCVQTSKFLSFLPEVIYIYLYDGRKVFHENWSKHQKVKIVDESIKKECDRRKC